MADLTDPDINDVQSETPDNSNGIQDSSRGGFKKEIKSWKAYFFEFLMVFLAVTLGFFAENLRENFMENVRERQYAQSLYDDLKMDTAIIQRTYEEKEWIQLKLDSAEKILASNNIEKYNEFIYYVERYVTLNDIFTSQDVTYQQLRSSGNFRYMSNLELYKKIADYYNLYTRYQSINGDFGIIDKNELSVIEASLFNISELISLDNENANNFYNLVLRPQGKFRPIVYDKENLDLLYIKIANAKSRTFKSKVLLGWLKYNATDLITDLKKEYNLK